ncbi:MAG: hypothetical protein KAT79_04775, partial [candidate division Zixibacteria bacterium]|nr:hypothetical protein [candidate division Zixibacteria bacterium]
DTDADSLASATFENIIANKVYYWRCRAIAKDGSDTTAFTFRRAFMPIVSLATGCAVPGLISPADEATIGTNRPSLVIENIATLDGSIYFFEVAADYDFTELLGGGVVTPQSADTTVWTVNTDLPIGQTGFWRVWMNNCPSSEVFRFMVASKSDASVFTYPNPFRPAETPELIFSGLPANSILTIISISGGTVR